MTDFKVLGINYGGHDTSVVLIVGDFMLTKGSD